MGPSQVEILFRVPSFCVGNMLHSASLTFPEFQGAETVVYQGREGRQKQRRGSQETIAQPWGRVLAPPQGIHRTVSLSSSAGTKAPTKVEDGTLCRAEDSQNTSWLTAPPTNQNKVLHTVEEDKGPDLFSKRFSL